jgi:hypothetical protein
VAWNAHYWGIIENIYWTPRFTGMRSIGQKSWIVTADSVTVPKRLVNQSGPLYSRRLKQGAFLEDLLRSEEILNHVFNITFGIAPDKILGELFFSPLGFNDLGPIESIGREIWRRFDWGEHENVMQHDGFFISNRSAVCVELKLAAPSSAEQVMKYAAMLTWEELVTGPKENLGLLYIVPNQAVARHWTKCGLDGPVIDRTFLSTKWRKPMPPKIQKLLNEHRGHVESVLDRMRIAVISWDQVEEKLCAIDNSLNEREPGGQTIHRLLSGFLGQLSAHKQTGLAASVVSGTSADC